jgi:anti-sigma factor RsiW
VKAARVMDECERFECSLTPYIDGELDPGHAVDVEAHMTMCSICAEKVALAMAMRQSLKRSVTRAAAPASLRDRVCGAMARQRAAEAQVEAAAAERPIDDDASPKLLRLRYAVALAAAAGVAFAMGISRHRPLGLDDAPVALASATPASPDAVFDSLLDDLVALHANPLPPETTNPAEVVNFEPLVGVPVHRPIFQPFGGRFQGARVNAMADRRALLLQYTVEGGHRVTVYVFNPRVVPVHPVRLQPRLQHERPLYVGTLRGYSVAAIENRKGVGYALASDLGDDETTQLMMAAAQE